MYSVVLILLPFLAVSYCVTVTGIISEDDVAGLKTVLKAPLVNPTDLPNVFYGVAGLKIADRSSKVANQDILCNFVKAKVDQTKPESIYYASGVAKRLDNCKLDLADAEKTLNAALTAGGMTSQELLAVVAGFVNLGIKYDNAKVTSALNDALKDRSAQSFANGLHIAAQLQGNLKPYVDLIEDMVAQADEINGAVLQFDGGLSSTANAIAGIYVLADKAAIPVPVKSDDAVKFANYLVARKNAQLPRAAYHLLKAAALMASNKAQVPVVFSLASGVAVRSDSPLVQIKVSNILGQSLGADIAVVVDSATHQATSGVVMNKKPINAVANDKTATLFELNFMEQKRESGFYKLLVSASSAKDKRLVGAAGQTMVKVLTSVSIDKVEFAISDREQVATQNVQKLSFPGKLSSVPECDVHQKIVMQFEINDKTNKKPIKVHQAFVVFTHQKTSQEIVFVAEPDTKNAYKFDVDLQKSANDFDNLSGKYSIDLVIGDAVIDNPVQWRVGDVSLKFPTKEKKVESGVDDISYIPLPEIKHLFNKPAERPPRFVSDVFTVLVLVPILVLFVLWLRIGVNVSNFPLSLYALGFHLGLGAIFGLYVIFWLQLNMFETLKYLAGVGGLTLLCGNAMLRSRADEKKPKTE